MPLTYGLISSAGARKQVLDYSKTGVSVTNVLEMLQSWTKPWYSLSLCLNMWAINSSPHGQNGRHFADNIFKCIFLNEKFCTWIQISLKFVFKVPIDNKSALVQVMAWGWIGSKPLSEPVIADMQRYWEIELIMLAILFWKLIYLWAFNWNGHWWVDLWYLYFICLFSI